jgi:hypothetical protein
VAVPCRVPVLLRWRSGEARAGVGDHGGGANLAGGCLGWPVHGEVAGACGGEVAGEANRCNRRGEKVRRARGEVAEFNSYTNFTRTQQRGEERSSPERGGTMASSLIESEGGRWSG